MKASLILHQQQVLLSGRYVITIKVYEVSKNQKFPDGIKAKFVLQNGDEGTVRLLVDNHEPYGFHMHTQLPHNREHREILDVADYMEALNVFMEEVERIIKNEET